MSSENLPGEDRRPAAEAATPFRSGFCALVGRPNAGKSTLVNACVGTHLAITSPVSQTTRKRLRAVINRRDAQLVLVDTPGLHKPKDSLGDALNRQALAELDDVDVVAHLIDATRDVGRGDAWVAAHVGRSPAVKLLLITKADIASPERVTAQIEAAQELAPYDDVLVVSAREGFNVDGFIDVCISHLPEGPRWFGADMDSDVTDEELVAEFVREQVLLATNDEIPHATGVICDELRWTKDAHASIRATIYVERSSQKAILIGAGGSMIRSIGTKARRALEALLDARIYLDLRVQVSRHWRKDAEMVRELGYDLEEE